MRTYIRAFAALLIPFATFAFAAPAFAQAAPVASATCIDLPNNLGVGARDTALSANVAHLQAYLKAVGFLAASTPSGAYGAQTRAAVQKFQAQAGLPTTGTVGPQTRAALADRSCPVGFSFMGINAPSTLAAGTTGTWLIGVTVPAGAASPLVSSVTWGDEASSTTSSGSGTVSLHGRIAYLTFTHTYAAAGTYPATFMITFGSQPPLPVRTQVTVK